MQVAELSRPVQAPLVVANWHRRRILLSAAVFCTLALFLTVYGFEYYTLDAAARAGASKHSQLRPSGTVANPLGILGGILFLLIFLYPLRKRWPWLGRRGKTRHWLDFHVLMGLTAPVIITFHSSFKLQGIAGLAYWIMMSVVVSGIVGRYFYAQIPRRLDAAEMSLTEMQETRENLGTQLRAQSVVPAAELEPLFQLPSASEVQAMGLPRALRLMVALDLRRALFLIRVWRHIRSSKADSRELQAVLSMAKRQAALSKEILFLSKAQAVFHLWHVVHRPFSYSFAILSVLHVLIVLLLGYF